MVNYYETLKVSPKASKTEIKSAYRSLARKLHPDKNNGSEQTARAFAAIAEAYEVLGNARDRALYDKRLVAQQMHSTNGDSVFASDNAHARRWRQMVYEHRYNEIIDRMIAEERRESMALQRIIFPTVALFVASLTVGIVRPHFFWSSENTVFNVVVKIVLIALFVSGLIQLLGRFREAFDKYTYDDLELHNSILDENEPKHKPYSRYTAVAFLLAGTLLCFGVGLLIGYNVAFEPGLTPYLFAAASKREMLTEAIFYPPIFVFVVDTVHYMLSRIEA